ncbi:hypothetical protein HKD37_18G051189 [Glycine soja]
MLHAHQLFPGLSSNHTVLRETFALIPFVISLIVDFSTALALRYFIGGTSHIILVGQNPLQVVIS